jgi:hypothetical protein
VIEAGGNYEALIMQRFPADGAARIAYAKSMSLDSYGDADPVVNSEYLLEHLHDIQRKERGHPSAGLHLERDASGRTRLLPVFFGRQHHA